MQNIDLNLLRVFDILLAERSVTRTAKRLSLTQSSVSSALNRLRNAISDQLFVRGEGGLVPTSTALALGEPVRQALNEIDKALNTCTTFVPSESEVRLKLWADEGVLSRILPHLLPIISNEAPLLSLEVSFAGNRNCFESLRTGELDLLITAITSGIPENFRAMRLHSETLCAVRACGSEHPLSVREFAAAKHIVCDPSDAAEVSAALAQLGYCDKNAFVIEGQLLAALTAKSTGCICLLPEGAASIAAAELGLMVSPLPISVTKQEVTMIWHERAHHNAGHRWLRGQISSIRSLLRQTSQELLLGPTTKAAKGASMLANVNTLF